MNEKYEKIISHRGNIDGRILEKENTIDYINCAIKNGYEVEIDVRTKNGLLYLGHDTPDYLVDMEWMFNIIGKLWIHCKDIDSYKIVSNIKNSRYFCHTSDSFSLISTNQLWVHDISLKLNENCIIPLLSIEDINNFSYTEKVHAICTDYVKNL